MPCSLPALFDNWPIGVNATDDTCSLFQEAKRGTADREQATLIRQVSNHTTRVPSSNRLLINEFVAHLHIVRVGY